jgi:hypothetical protein
MTKDDSGAIAATPLVSGDFVDGPTFISPSAAAAAAAAAFAASLQIPAQPWEMTASCFSLLAASSAHYPQLVRIFVLLCALISLVSPDVNKTI